MYYATERDPDGSYVFTSIAVRNVIIERVCKRPEEYIRKPLILVVLKNGSIQGSCYD